MQDRTDSRAKIIRLAHYNTTASPTRPILCIDLLPDELETTRSYLSGSDRPIQPMPYRELDETALDKFRPELIVAPLFSECFDAVDVAETLALAGYFGELWAVGPALPNPRLIEGEIREFAAGIAFRLITQEGRIRTGT